MSLLTDNDSFFDLNENPKIPDVSVVGKAFMNVQNQQPKVVIGNLTVAQVVKKTPSKTLREELEVIRRDTQL
ncbi:hypothetical protein [uncultured Tenacibaculum sp.]|uniref:hypothetical protein n=1 Tax=Tenacibaculum halocynthiae TaxID=1254437 RepID=UPI002632BCF6|nr:hypothetical protein [uncultured Tenacibaculum sp.]